MLESTFPIHAHAVQLIRANDGRSDGTDEDQRDLSMETGTDQMTDKRTLTVHPIVVCCCVNGPVGMSI